MRVAALSAKRDWPQPSAGAIVVCCAVAAAIAAAALGEQVGVAVGLGFFAAGLSHGAAEESREQISRIGLPQAIAYLLIAAAVAGLLLAQPMAGLTLFLALSGWHFVQDEGGFGLASRYALAGLTVGGSALFQPEATSQVFSALMGQEVHPSVIPALAVVGAGGALCLLPAIHRREAGAGIAILSLAAVAALSPVLAVGLVFLIGHAAPVQSAQIERYGLSAVRNAVLLPTVIAMGGAVLLVAGVFLSLVPLPIAAALAIGLATPHMLAGRL